MQIKPEGPLRSSSLMSKEEHLLHDYEMGFVAGKRLVESFNKAYKGSTLSDPLYIPQAP